MPAVWPQTDLLQNAAAMRPIRRRAECGGGKKEPAKSDLCDKAHPAKYRGCEYALKPRRATLVTKERSSAVAGKKPQANTPERAPESGPGLSKERQSPPPKPK